VLHFGGVDFLTTVYVNGQRVGEHAGGHTPFELDISSALKKSGENELVVKVWDPTDAGTQPRGKQERKPNGIWYTPVTGIWQTVWIERVPETSIARLKLTPDVDAGTLKVETMLRGGADGADIEIVALDGGREVAKASGKSGEAISLKIDGAKTWTPDSPFLYDLVVTAKDGASTDTVKSYFAMRKVSMKTDVAGYPRIALNNTPLFMFGPLDQGWWPDGLYTAPTDEALKWDIEFTKKLGLNMARKHIKVEPARWYYWCDKLGLAVWQDQSSGMGERRNQGVAGGSKEDAFFTPNEKVQFMAELREMIDSLHNHPSIVAWVPFNEGWGQHDTNDVLKWTKAYDPTRLVDGPSGWEDRGYGDMHDMHNYPGPGMFPTTADRISVLGEFGGLGLPVEGHLWQSDKNWGYRTYKTKEELGERYADLIERMVPLARRGLAAAVYTQTTDVEGEVNGYATYDRKAVKFDFDRTAALSRKVIEAANDPVRVVELVPTSRQTPQAYSYTFEKPADNWQLPQFDAKAWKTGPGGFGTAHTPGAVVKTEWTGDDIWLRRTVKLERVPNGEVMLNIHHDDDVEVYINGILAYKASDALGSYTLRPISAEARAGLKEGDNVVAVHCHQRGGGQFVDVGFSELQPVGK
ncbi:MAG: beta-galactosidase, partial [Proteobacteria bacterium]